MGHTSVGPKEMSYHLLEEITDCFSEGRKIGRGGYGKVYMGVHKDGKKIAVKKLYDMPELDNEQQFTKEFENLASLQHQNIVQLVGYCYEIQKKYTEYQGRLVFAEEIHRALCFEYMHNGSLDKHLFDEHSGHDWHKRYAIIKGICKGLKYLHEELESPMYHLDLKPANVLLDDNLLPKIADFGLSKLFGEEQTRITKNFKGTFGYLPPEYIQKNVVSNKLDIFSLGVVIIKIMTGPTGYSKSDEMSSQEFIDLVHGNWRNRLQETLGHALELYSKQVKSCIEIALSCVEINRHKRPTIGDIVNKLNETEIMIHELPQFTHESRNDPGSLMDQTSPGMSTDSELPGASQETESESPGAPQETESELPGASQETESELPGAPQEMESEFGEGPSNAVYKMASIPRQFRYRDLADATDNFSSRNKLGEGTFAAVYKATFKDQDGMRHQVAVKKIFNSSSEEKKDLLAEVNIIGQTRHRNIIRLKGWCCRKNRWFWQMKYDQLFVVYELMPNGNLHGHLHQMDQVLPWPKRYKIVKGIGSALVYLHHECQPFILHRYIKPSNILLDYDFNDKLAGFSLSLIADHNETTLWAIAIGTVGYMDPSCMKCGEVEFDRSYDVYSFGIVLLEIACCGKSRERVWDLYRSSSTELVIEAAADERLGGHFDRGQMQRVLVLGLWCSLLDSAQRPTMLQVMQVLENNAPLPDLASFS